MPNLEKNSTVKVSVIICTFNRVDLIGSSILAIQRQVFPADKYEIIVVDNNSTDGTGEIVRNIADSSPVRLKYVFEGHQGLSFARNSGIRNSNGEILAFVDDDIDAESGWLTSLVAAFDDPDVFAVGGPIRAIWLAPRPTWLSDRWQGHFTVSEFHHAQASGEFKYPSYPWGANMAFRAKVFAEGMMFPTDLGRIGNCLLSNEEIFLFRRIETDGRKIGFAPKAVIHHKIPPERMRKLWLYHRTYWQGRSEAIVDINENTNLYRNFLKNLSTLSSSTSSTTESAFDRRCVGKAAFGYIYQVLYRNAGKGDFRRIRALRVLLHSLLSVTPSDEPAVAQEIPDMLTQELLRQKDEQLDSLLNSWSWKITKPLRYVIDIISRIKGMSSKG